MRTRIAAIPAALIALLAPAACATGETTVARTAAATPGVAVLDCGSFDLGQGEDLAVTATDCVTAAAREHRPARLAYSRLTTEGDPIRYLIEVDPASTVVITTDTREDDFGPQDVTRQSCTRLVVAFGFPAGENCTDL